MFLFLCAQHEETPDLLWKDSARAELKDTLRRQFQEFLEAFVAPLPRFFSPSITFPPHVRKRLSPCFSVEVCSVSMPRPAPPWLLPAMAHSSQENSQYCWELDPSFEMHFVSLGSELQVRGVLWFTFRPSSVAPPSPISQIIENCAPCSPMPVSPKSLSLEGERMSTKSKRVLFSVLYLIPLSHEGLLSHLYHSL